MKNIILAAAFVMFSAVLVKAQIYSTSEGKVAFFSTTPLEDIAATNDHVLAVMNGKKEIAVSISNTGFIFKKKLMQEHFNEKYMESELYPTSTFKGRINEDINLAKDGEYKVTATGKLNIHGVEQLRTISGTLVVKNGTIRLYTTFMVKNVDHKIEIPTVVSAKIQEEIEVKVDLLLLPKK